jgi:hypothetical protein
MHDVQKPSELKAAEKRLKELAANGDDSAADALADPGAPQVHWDAIYEAIETIKVTGSEGELVPQSTKERILNWNADVCNYASTKLLSGVLANVPGIFRLIQGGSAWQSKYRDITTDEHVTAASAINALIFLIEEQLESFYPLLRDNLHKDVRAHQVDMLQRAVRYEDPSLAGMSVDEVPALVDDPTLQYFKNRDKAVADAMQILNNARTAMLASHGLRKLKAAVSQLEIIDRFGMASEPVRLPMMVSADSKEVLNVSASCDLLGVPCEWRDNFAKLAPLFKQWNAHRESYKPHLSLPTASELFCYWMRLRDDAPELSELALLRLIQPVSSAGLERVFSYLSQLDRFQEQSMQKETLHNVLFLRANWHIVDLLLLEEAARYAERPHHDIHFMGHASKRVRLATVDALGALHAAIDARVGSAESDHGDCRGDMSDGDSPTPTK